MSVPTIDVPLFDHISLGVEQLERSRAFYKAALEPLGWEELWSDSKAVGFGPIGFAGEAPLALIAVDRAKPSPGFHLALVASDRDAVRRSHASAIAHGGTDDGPPGVREHYDPGYFAAFIQDPDGYRLEVVVHEVEPPREIESAEAMPETVRHAVAAARARPDDVAAQIEAAYACDGAGFEFLAAGFYDTAWELGVPQSSRREFVICYGSTLRNVGRLDEAKGLLNDHLSAHSDDRVARCFRALTSHSAGESDSAVAELLDVVIGLSSESSPGGFWRALSEYRDVLTQE